MISAAQAASVVGAAAGVAGGSSAADTCILRVHEVRAHDLKLAKLPVHRTSAGEARADAPAAPGKQREPDPALNFGGGRAGGDVTEAHRRCARLNDLRA